jgi:hypothetical protein
MIKGSGLHLPKCPKQQLLGLILLTILDCIKKIVEIVVGRPAW